MTRFQNQCFLHISIISSIGTPLVSGRKTTTKMVIIVIQPAKKKKIPYLKEQSSDRKACAMTNVKRRLTATVMLCPADLVSRGNISLGTVHPSGPHDHPNAATKRQIITTTRTEKPLESSPFSSNFNAKIMATAACSSVHSFTQRNYIFRIEYKEMVSYKKM
ncbi:hypothetical protein Scep_008295 [Stephania cephalantha]|uniref:Uncharacterized protein n=1 Tax=Stephania cephalantha TaxID=152367 RepID=A0AAP0KD72_9MAGN